MKQFILTLAAACILSSCCTQKVVKLPNDQPKLNDVLTVVQEQYKAALDSLAKEGIKNYEIVEAQLSLKVSKTISGDAEFSVLIFKPKASRSLSRSTTVAYKLSKAESITGGDKKNEQKTDNSLRDAIINATKSFNQMEKTIGTLIKESFSLDLVFSIEEEKGVGLSFKVWGIGADLGGTFSSATEHELVLTFKPVKKV